MLPTVARQHIVAATAATLSYQGVDSDGEPADPGTVTVTVVGSAPTATAIATDAATGGTGTDPRTVSLTASQTASLDQLRATWTAGGVVLATTLHDIVGGVLITKADFIRREPKRASVTVADFLATRFEVDAMFRRMTGRSFVPRYEVETVNERDGYRLTLAHPDVRTLEWATDEDGVAIDLTDAVIHRSGVVDLDCAFHRYGKITVGYTHGMDAPPDEVVGAAAVLIRTKLTEGKSMIPARADSFETNLGTASFVPRAGYGRALTAIDEVDEVLNAYKMPAVA